MHPTRRAFTLGGAALGAALQIPAASPTPSPTICLFSKHLPKLHYSELGGVLKDLGFAGCDLTVRPGGHVEPALSAADLYRAVEAIRAEGVEIPMITTAFVSAADPTMPNVLALCGRDRMKVPYFKLGYWNYRPGDNIETRIAEVRRDVLTGLGNVKDLTARMNQHGVLAAVRERIRCCDLHHLYSGKPPAADRRRNGLRTRRARRARAIDDLLRWPHHQRNA